MNRSVKGLKSAGEWKTPDKMLPNFKGKRVLDLGCEFGKNLLVKNSLHSL